jgi:hypothetical protein
MAGSMTPLEAAAQRLAAIEALQAQLAGHIDTAQRELLRGLLLRLEDTYADPSALAAVMAEYQAAVAVPLAVFYAQALLTLPLHTATYFAALDVAGYQALRAPLASFLEQRLGVTAAGQPVAGGWLATFVGDTTAQREVLAYAYQAQASGVGLQAYRAGLTDLVVGANSATQGLIGKLYREASDSFNQNDRQLQHLSAQRLGLKAYLYQGGLIATSRPFCKLRNGKVFLDWEVEAFGTKADAYGGYTNKAEGLFSGKSQPYDPFVDCGGHGCRHALHALPSLVALRLRPELGENDKGELYIKSDPPA